MYWGELELCGGGKLELGGGSEVRGKSIGLVGVVLNRSVSLVVMVSDVWYMVQLVVWE